MDQGTVQLDHGSGGQATDELVQNCFIRALANVYLLELNDSAVIPWEGGHMALTTDSYVVDPIFFPGGDIGSLAVHGTVNDLAMRGARPLYLTAGFILEEGLSLDVLERVVHSMARAARDAGVMVVAGDTKVVPRGKADLLFINTAGVGMVLPGVRVGGQWAQPGDSVLINGAIGNHGMAVLCKREGLSLENEILSDSAPLNGLVCRILEGCPRVHVLRDPTRGGVAAVLNEIARQSRVGVVIEEEALPVDSEVAGACEILGLDPLYTANEGKVLVIVPPEDESLVLEIMRGHPLGRMACKIGFVSHESPGKVTVKTRIGGRRVAPMLRGEQLPRIC